MKPAVLVFVACVLGCVIGGLSTGSRPSQESRDANRATGSNNPAISGTTQETEPQLDAVDVSEPQPYVVVETKDYSLLNRRRISVKIVLEFRETDSGIIQAMLLDLARSQNADAVLVYAYWPGDDWQNAYTLGMLEWGRNGVGWASDTQLPADGMFHPGEHSVAITEAGARKNGMTDTDLSIYKSFVYGVFVPSMTKLEKIFKLAKNMNPNDLDMQSLSIYQLYKEVDDGFTRVKTELKSEQARKVCEDAERIYQQARDQAVLVLPSVKIFRRGDAALRSQKQIAEEMYIYYPMQKQLMDEILDPKNSPPSNSRLEADRDNPLAGEIHKILIPLGYKLAEDAFHLRNGTTCIMYEVERRYGAFNPKMTRLVRTSNKGIEWDATRIRISGDRVYSVNSLDERKELDLTP